MENLSGYTLIELNKISNDIVAKHGLLKKEIIDASYQAEELEKSINEKLVLLNELEKNYVELVEELNKRNVIS